MQILTSRSVRFWIRAGWWSFSFFCAQVSVRISKASHSELFFFLVAIPFLKKKKQRRENVDPWPCFNAQNQFWCFMRFYGNSYITIASMFVITGCVCVQKYALISMFATTFLICSGSILEGANNQMRIWFGIARLDNGGILAFLLS